ncbi:hypothetical protein LG201_07955 [Methylobacillus gramineus]|uniref:hypothetical protein n=1 Tax=Methylobacillus gramineus TaxID=755169 RepID=UPI001CFFA6C8|nr:hypothetical protein [Methylobacillus gramineus]MCB5185136.1 hypothetical protein [Methylobacillus gramineus]
MATLSNEVIGRNADGFISRISWRAILAGLAVAVAVQLILSLLGTGVGFSFVDPVEVGATPSAKSFGIGASLWWIVSWILSLTAGTIVAVMSSDVITRCRGAILGIVIWALATIVGACVFSNLVGGAFKTAGSAVGIAGTGAVAAGALLTTEGSSGAGLGVEDLKFQIQDFIRNAKGSIDQQIAEGATDGAAPPPKQGGPRAGHGQHALYWQALTKYLANADETSKAVDRERVVATLADAAGVSKEQAEAELQKLEAAYDQAKQKAKEAADKAASAAAHFALWATLGFILSLLAATFAGACTARSLTQANVKHTY